jgi:hypothetical protein
MNILEPAPCNALRAVRLTGVLDTLPGRPAETQDGSRPGASRESPVTPPARTQHLPPSSVCRPGASSAAVGVRSATMMQR